MRALALLAALAGWSAPQDLSSGHRFVDRPALTVSQDGTALATWSFTDPTRDGVSAATRPPGADTFGPPHPLTRPSRRSDVLHGVAAYGRSRALAAITRTVGSDASQRVRLDVRFGSTSGRFGSRHTIRRAGTPRAPSHVNDVALAVNAGGDAALAWFEDRGVRTDRVYVALRRAGGRFGKPRRLATGRIRGIATAVGAAGDVLVAWDARGVLRTRFKPRGRRGFRATDTIRSQEAYFADMTPLVTSDGRAVLAWSAQFISEGGGSRDVYFQAAVRPRGAGRFRRAQQLERLGPGQVQRPLDAALTADERAVVAWTGFDGTRRRARAAVEDADGVFGPPLDASPATEDAILSDVEAAPDGRVIVVWDPGYDGSGPVRAALAPLAGAPFGPPEDVSPAGRSARQGQTAFDPLSGRPTVVYSIQPSGGAIFPQAATRAM